ncbi:MAG: hypothetical protein K0R65_2800 [Crocinitomicaceae bacterium]|jgi:hypothetical protein|nr:hypothetical protein [Crocinitomicaceae bacterium]
MKKVLLIVIPLLSLLSCVDMSDELILNSDGSGTFKYVLNLSQSKLKVNSILALDSLDGRKVPSIEEIKETINEYKHKLEEKEGISNVKVETDFSFFILKFQCDFTTVQNLQKAIRELAQEQDKKGEYKELNHTWLEWDGSKLVRSVPTLPAQLTRRLKQEDAEAMKKGKYTSITRFDRLIDYCENPQAKIPQSKTVCAIMTNPYALVQNIKLLENTIYLTNIKKSP